MDFRANFAQIFKQSETNFNLAFGFKQFGTDKVVDDFTQYVEIGLLLQEGLDKIELLQYHDCNETDLTNFSWESRFDSESIKERSLNLMCVDDPDKIEVNFSLDSNTLKTF